MDRIERSWCISRDLQTPRESRLDAHTKTAFYQDAPYFVSEVVLKPLL